MTLSERLAENVRACFAGIWIQSCEHDDAISEIARLCHGENWRLATWDIDQGLQASGQTNESLSEAAGADPLAAVRALAAMAIPLTAAAQNVVPVAVTAGESVERLRQWASGRCLGADVPGIYTFNSTKKQKRRRINVEPSNN